MIINELDRKLIDRVGERFVNIDKMRELVAAGTDVNAKDVNGVTALMHADCPGNVEVLQFLIDNGADVNAVDNRERLRSCTCFFH